MEDNIQKEEKGVIETALAKENITNQVIAKLKADYSGLTINGLDDREGFKKVEDARKECKAIRVLATKICKAGREEAIKIQKEWIEKEKEVVGAISEIETALEAESDRIKLEEKRILFEAAQKAKLPVRKEKLMTVGVEVPDEELLKIDDDQFQQLFNEFHTKYLEEKEAKIQKEIDDKLAEEKRLREEAAKAKKAEHDARLDKMWKLGLKFNGESFTFKNDFGFIEIHHTDLIVWTKEEFEQKFKEVTDLKIKWEANQEKKDKEEAEKEAKKKESETLQTKRLNEILPYNNPVSNTTDLTKLGELPEAEYQEILTNKRVDWEKAQTEAKQKAYIAVKEKQAAEEKAAALQKQLEEKQAAELKAQAEAKAKAEAELAMGDKPKMEAFIQDMEALKTKYEFKAAKYKTIQTSVNELLDKTVTYAKSKL